MQKGQNEIRIIWLMILVIVAVAAWFYDQHIISYICGLAFVLSVMQYVDQLQKPIPDLSRQANVRVQLTSKVPLYISSIIAVIGISMQWSWLIGLGLTAWIFFFLRWLRRLEVYLSLIEYQLKKIQQHVPDLENEPIPHLDKTQVKTSLSENNQDNLGLAEQIKHWIFQGNPVLKVAIIVLVIGLILLLRFATEHWQLSLALKLLIVAGISFAISLVGWLMFNKNRSFALALEGLGLAGLFLTLFFAYYNHVIASFALASVCFGIIMLITLWMSLKQHTIELAMMAMLIAYVAPFTLPVRSASSVEFVAYYLAINLAVAILTTLRPWKILNQIAFLMSIFISAGYVYLHGYMHERLQLAGLVILHTLVFVWLSFRFSQLIAKQDVEEFKLKPALDIALIFGAPIIGYIFLYLIYFHESAWQAGFSLAFAVLYAVIYYFAKNNQSIQLISQSYFSLMLIFIALIPPILLPEQWSVMGWAMEGALIYVFALLRQSTISRYLASGLLVVAGLSSFYYYVQLDEFPRLMFWTLSLCYYAVVVYSNSRPAFQKQLGAMTTIFQALLMLAASSMLLVLLLDQFKTENQFAMTMLIISILLLILNEIMLFCKAGGQWFIAKWIGVIPVFVLALIIVLDHSQNGMIVWASTFEQIGIAVSGLLLFLFWLRPVSSIRFEKEALSLGALSSLSLTSLCLIPSMPYISVVILPLAFAAWCFWQKEHEDWNRFWQARSSLALMLIWIVCSQLFTVQAFQGYLLPILNPFDLVSIAILASFIWMLSLQLKTGLDRGIVAVLIVLSLLWLSSYILLRALHVYLGTPYNALELWQDATVQLSFTLLWVSLALITMSYASKRQIRSMWILGGSILVIVTLKLVLLDLSHIGTLMRVISFLGAGTVMLVIAYIAPIPELDERS
ncbi:DUF2339 domain-containing protein [Acinetobacter gerneri]|uniref:DUF2339 domain-containing protein n=1 Tax=Acinetobacter gerneri TaxID=202952 RepID=UPI0029360C34|nr:DUF2339 domain-containing protein [Acinetobacter gerneri]MDV2440348.1 DUF2339 domain-containing protein [Acinetobacter gerneri]